jgi:hypothetical protein
MLLAVLTAAGCGRTDRGSSALKDDNELFVWDTDAAPELRAGPGAGEWNSERPRPDNVVLARSAKSYLGTSDARQRYGDEAAGTFRHYFDNDGAVYAVSLPKLLNDVPRVFALYENLMKQARAAVTARSRGTHLFSMREAAVTSIDRAEDENWYLAVAGFSYWISGSLVLGDDDSVGGTVTLHLWDRYDWDPGVVIPISTPFGRVDVDQDRVGEFHRQGLAREFDTTGSLELQF